MNEDHIHIEVLIFILEPALLIATYIFLLHTTKINILLVK